MKFVSIFLLILVLVAPAKLACQTLAGAQLKRVTRPKPLPVDKGEEPADDDTPVVVRKP